METLKQKKPVDFSNLILSNLETKLEDEMDINNNFYYPMLNQRLQGSLIEIFSYLSGVYPEAYLGLLENYNRKQY